MRLSRLSALFLACAAAACNPAPVSQRPADECRGKAYAEIGGPLSLVRHDGERITEESFKGRRSLVFFGFTHCPDVCPNTLYALGAALNQLPEGVEAPRTVLISVDPERDTPEALAAYIRSNGFPSEIVGLTGTPEDIKAVSKSFAAWFNKVEDEASRTGYLVDHTALVYLMDETWRLQTYFTPETRPAEMAACIAELAAG